MDFPNMFFFPQHHWKYLHAGFNYGFTHCHLLSRFCSVYALGLTVIRDKTRAGAKKKRAQKLISESVQGTSAEDQQRAVFNRAQSSVDLSPVIVLCCERVCTVQHRLGTCGWSCSEQSVKQPQDTVCDHYHDYAFISSVNMMVHRSTSYTHSLKTSKRHWPNVWMLSFQSFSWASFIVLLHYFNSYSLLRRTARWCRFQTLKLLSTPIKAISNHIKLFAICGLGGGQLINGVVI